MRISKIDLLMSDNGWKGILTRLTGVSVFYLILLYLPEISSWASAHFNIENASATQLEKHRSIMYVVRIIIGMAFCIEIINIIKMTILKRKRRY